MSHWFDRLAMAASGTGDEVSRRGVLKGAGAAALAVSPLAAPAAALASSEPRTKPRAQAAATPECNKCTFDTITDHNRKMRNCDRTGSLWGNVPKGKSKKKARPVNAAKRLGCALVQRANLARDLNKCRIGPCNGQALEPLQPDPNSPFKPPGSSQPSCPPGTTTCGDGSCCYGGDLCCYCIHMSPPGFICCVAVVGCTCCPQG